TAQATRGTGITIVAAPVFLRVGRVMVSSVIAEEGLGILYLFDYYWRRARKHVAVIFYSRFCNYLSLGNLRGGKNCCGLSYSAFRIIFSITCAHNNEIDRKIPEVVAFHTWPHDKREGIYLMEKMRILILFVIVASFGASVMVGCGPGVAVQDPPVIANHGNAQPKKTLRAFSSEQELAAY